VSHVLGRSVSGNCLAYPRGAKILRAPARTGISGSGLPRLGDRAFQPAVIALLLVPGAALISTSQ